MEWSSLWRIRNLLILLVNEITNELTMDSIDDEARRYFASKTEMRGPYRTNTKTSLLGKGIPNTLRVQEYEESEFNESSYGSSGETKPCIEKENPISFPLYRRHPKTSPQAQIYNFLERPTGWKCFIYHFTV